MEVKDILGVKIFWVSNGCQNILGVKWV